MTANPAPTPEAVEAAKKLCPTLTVQGHFDGNTCGDCEHIAAFLTAYSAEKDKTIAELRANLFKRINQAESAESALANLQGMFDNVVKDRDSWREVAEQHARDNAALRAPVEDAEVEEALNKLTERTVETHQGDGPDVYVCCGADEYHKKHEADCPAMTLARALRQSRVRVAELEAKIGCRGPYCNDGCVCDSQEKPS